MIEATAEHVDRRHPVQRGREQLGWGPQVLDEFQPGLYRFDPNIQTKRYYVPSLGRTVRLRVSARGLRTIDRREIEAVVAELRSRGEKI